VFEHGAPNYRKDAYSENIMSEALWIKDPITVLAGMNLQNVTESVCLYGENGQLYRREWRSEMSSQSPEF